jgi:hypothetical protein
MNDDNIMACILFAKSQGLAAADDAATDYAQLRATVGRLEGEMRRIDRATTEWEANHMGGVSIQRKRWQRCGEIARAALAADGERGTG